MRVPEWWQEGWQKLPAWRLDLQGEREQPLNVQWAGDLRSVRYQLMSRGWHQPPALSVRTGLGWLLPNPSLGQLPVLPQLHDGQYESLLLIDDGDGKTPPAEQRILRLWPTTLRLQPGDTPVWIGTVASLRIERLPLISFPRSSGGYDPAQTTLESILINVKWKPVQRPLRKQEEDIRWSGTVLLIDSGR
jgi:undecaprenyl-diphosphatase